jgi:hypothetical protein
MSGVNCLRFLYKSLLKNKQTYNNVNITGKKLHYNLLYCLQKAKSKEPALASIQQAWGDNAVPIPLDVHKRSINQLAQSSQVWVLDDGFDQQEREEMSIVAHLQYTCSYQLLIEKNISSPKIRGLC